MTNDQAYNLIENSFLNKDTYQTIWEDTWGTNKTDQEAVKYGLNKFSGNISNNCQCFLYGYIDQAVLEINSSGSFEEISEKAITYRPAQWGDSGLLAVNPDGVYSFDISFEGGHLSITKHKETEQGAAPNSGDCAPCVG